MTIGAVDMYGSLMADTLRRLNEIDPHSVIALGDIAAERLRQIEGEGWTPDHDDKHASGEMAYAAACYAMAPHTHRGATAEPPPRLAVDQVANTPRISLHIWPWDLQWWKPGSKHRNRIRAGALLVAELVRWGRSGVINQEKA